MKKRMTILDKAEAAMKKAIKKVVAQHKKDGRPLFIWKDGKVKKIFADQIKK
jgi:hypothetical protein